MTLAPDQLAAEVDAVAADDSTPTMWRCGECGRSQADDRDGTQFCEACGRPRIDVEWSRRIKRIGLILFGITIQILTGGMMFLVPPGASRWAWVIYLAMGLIGFLHMFIGIELSRRDAREQTECAGEAQKKAHGLEAMGGENDDFTEALPLHARRCPACDHSLMQTIDRGRRTCPDCGMRFSLRELGFRRDDPAGELHAPSPHEARLGGGALVAFLLTAGIMAGVVLTTLLAIGGHGGTPGP